jgi:Ni,Fe-hydrogenase III large subunit
VLHVPARDVPDLGIDGFLERVRAGVAVGERPVTLYGRSSAGPGAAPEQVVLTCVLCGPGGLSLARATVERARGYPALSRDLTRFHALERELFEQHQVTPHEHPWLKPVRFAGDATRLEDYPFFKVAGKEVHEVQVGPIHASVIEPGAFRFMCHGETVHHLEVHLGFQHRGVEALLLRRPPKLLAPLVESIVGDSSVAYAIGYARAIEALAGHRVPDEHELVRAIGLELERIAMHLAGLAGMANDVAFLPGSTTYGRLRTAIINASQRICGNRFGRGWIRPGGVRAGLPREVAAAVREALGAFERDLRGCNDLMFSSRTVAHRLHGAGVVSTSVARELGLVGLAARASGVAIDLRRDLPCRSFERLALEPLTEPDGDCWARARLRARELDASLSWLGRALDAAGDALPGGVAPTGVLAPDTLVVSLVEGWRGEVVQVLETDSQGALLHYKVQDPSLLNWQGLAMAVRENAIFDFPICNKSFDLSYCGNDL